MYEYKISLSVLTGAPLKICIITWHTDSDSLRDSTLKPSVFSQVLLTLCNIVLALVAMHHTQHDNAACTVM